MQEQNYIFSSDFWRKDVKILIMCNFCAKWTLINFTLRYPYPMRMTATSGDTRGGVGDDLAEVFRGNGTALMGGVGIVVERHEAVLLDNGFGPCYSFLATELSLLWHHFHVANTYSFLDSTILFSLFFVPFVTKSHRISLIFGGISNFL